MAREIIFRGKRVDNGKWVYGDFIHRRIWGKDVAIILTEDNGFDSYVEYEVLPNTVGQYTGLTDKNGTKIFEGDILEYGSNEELCEVVYREEDAMFYARFYDVLESFGDVIDSWFEVVGNIHEGVQ